MSPDCIDVERIAEVENNAALRAHAEECPRCQSLWRSYMAFMKADVSGAPHADVARRALERTIRQQAGMGAGASPPHDARAQARAARPAWLRPALVTVAAAAIAVVALTLWRGGSDQPVLRGSEREAWSLQPPRVSAMTIDFAWNPFPGANAYEVVVYDDALNEVLHSGGVVSPSITVNREALSQFPAGTSLTWRVQAIQLGDIISTSPPASLVLK